MELPGASSVNARNLQMQQTLQTTTSSHRFA